MAESSTPKYLVSSAELTLLSAQLARDIIASGFVPDFLVALWRGGATIGCIVHEVFKHKVRGVHLVPPHARGQGYTKVDHIAIRTSRSTGVDEFASSVVVHNLGYLTERVRPEHRVLIVDDIWDSGLTIDAVLKKLPPCHVRVATPFFKPGRNKLVGRKPDYYLNETTAWVVLPHELEGLTEEEIVQHMGPEVAGVLNEIVPTTTT
jgi:hypoxanthine phosphoribosyltransferase